MATADASPKLGQTPELVLPDATPLRLSEEAKEAIREWPPSWSPQSI